MEIAAHLRVDPEMAVYNRIGLEYLMTSHRQSDDETSGPTSIALIDVDRFRRIHQELGAARSDALLGVFAEMAERALGHNRGFDRAARIGGHSFAFFLGYTPLSGAEMVCERLRQQVEAASFVIGERELEFTVSCSAIELQPTETMSGALLRLRAGLVEARKAGRNRTCLVDGQQQTIVQPTQYQVTGQTIEVPCPKML
jgi:diguanylate cyclase (GGDEF)-like protein